MDSNLESLATVYLSWGSHVCQETCKGAIERGGCQGAEDIMVVEEGKGKLEQDKGRCGRMG